MGLPSLQTPYYLAGNAKHRYHYQKAEKNAYKSVGLAATGAAMLHPKTQRLSLTLLASQGFRIEPQHARAFGAALAFSGAATGAYAGAHYNKARKYKAYYMAKRGKKRVRVRGRG